MCFVRHRAQHLSRFRVSATQTKATGNAELDVSQWPDWLRVKTTTSTSSQCLQPDMPFAAYRFEITSNRCPFGIVTPRSYVRK